MDILIDEKNDDITLLQFIKRNTDISSAHLKRLKFTDGGITVNGRHATVRYVLKKGDILSLATEDKESPPHITPCKLPIDIAYEDEDCVIPSKPADMPTHPSRDHYDDTVANALAFRYGELCIPFVFRPVNRLDRNTSGLLIVAKNRIAAGKLSAAMAEGKIKKTYLAILSGKLPQKEGKIETNLRRTSGSIIVREVCGENEGGDYALTEYRVLLEKNGYSLVAASPITGRTHQLRVHFSSLGCPILGDDLYGEPSPLIDRQALHSALVSFPKPSNGETISVTAPPPEDMQKVIAILFDKSELRNIKAICHH